MDGGLSRVARRKLSQLDVADPYRTLSGGAVVHVGRDALVRRRPARRRGHDRHQAPDASGRAARAAIGVDGHFRLETAGRRGVRAGRYRVAVRPQLVVGHPAHGPAVAPRHGAFDGSGIEFEVPRGGREDLVVTVEAAD